MKNKLFLLGMLAMVLVLGMTVVGCDDDSDGLDSALFGTWVHAEGEAITFNSNGTFNLAWEGIIMMSGTWSASSGILTVTSEGETDSVPYSFSGGNLFIDGEGPYIKQ